ncbi:unnamed protein product [Cuscuta campestris]|uniref:Uncharacterized protein n=1 Tax=Cuscuta campestris TaxID=132261 RepID=A0A484M0Z2_9ASTE|nr:unnamed protein product [Cuscuta campestris]
MGALGRTVVAAGDHSHVLVVGNHSPLSVVREVVMHKDNPVLAAVGNCIPADGAVVGVGMPREADHILLVEGGADPYETYIELVEPPLEHALLPVCHLFCPSQLCVVSMKYMHMITHRQENL